MKTLILILSLIPSMLYAASGESGINETLNFRGIKFQTTAKYVVEDFVMCLENNTNVTIKITSIDESENTIGYELIGKETRETELIFDKCAIDITDVKEYTTTELVLFPETNLEKRERAYVGDIYADVYATLRSVVDCIEKNTNLAVTITSIDQEQKNIIYNVLHLDGRDVADLEKRQVKACGVVSGLKNITSNSMQIK